MDSNQTNVILVIIQILQHVQPINIQIVVASYIGEKVVVDQWKILKNGGGTRFMHW